MATVVLGTALPRIDLSVQAGQSFTVSVPVLDGSSAPVPATDLVSARAYIRPSVASDQVLHVFSTEEDPVNLEITGTSAAILVITASSVDTSGWQLLWPALEAWWDIEVTAAGSDPEQITAPGLITLNPEVTR